MAQHTGKSATKAIETTVPGEIAGLTSKTTPVDDDNLLIEDSASTPPHAKKRLLWSNLRATLAGVLAPAAHNHVQADVTDLVHTDTAAIHTTTAAEVSGLSAKATPVDADVIPIEDSEMTPTAFGKKKLTWAQLKATLAGALAPASHNHVQADVTDLVHTDTAAIHTTTAAEVSGLSAKATPVDADVMLIEDSETTPTAFGKKKATIAALKTIFASGGTDSTAIHDNVDGEIAAVAEKATPVGADLILLEDSGAANAKKRTTADAIANRATKTVVVDLFDVDEAVATGDGKAYFVVPIELNGMNLVSVGAHVFTASSSGTPTVQAHNLTDTVDMLSTLITIDANEYDSKDAAAAAVIDTDHDDVATGDVIRLDVDVAGTGTKGLQVRLGFRLP